MDDALAQIDYAPAPAGLGRRWRRRIIIVLTIGCFVTAAWKFGPGFVHRASLVSLQRQCMTYTAPPNQVVYEVDATAAKRLLAAGAGYATRDGVSAHLVPPDWSKFHKTLGGGFNTMADVLMHELTTPQGERRLVFVNMFLANVGGNPIPPIRIAGFNSGAIEPGSVYRLPKFARTSTFGDAQNIRIYQAANTLRIYAGQVDPHDPSRFTFFYELNGAKRTVEGRLLDGATVVLEHTDSPERLKRELKESLKE